MTTRSSSLTGSLTSVAGLSVGHWTDVEAATGCTVVLAPPAGCVASGSVCGSAPGTRETSLLEPDKTVERVQAVLLSGGSAFGLAAADGVVRWCEAQERGFQTAFARVPIVPAAVIYDLGVGRADVRPDAEAGFQAAASASGEAVPSGRLGAGAGATCGKYLGPELAQYGGLGNAARQVRGATVAALVVVNPVGDIVDPSSGKVLAGARRQGGPVSEVDIVELFGAQPGGNTTLVVVGTDAPLNKTQAKILADSAHMGIARVTRPSHTLFDGDSSFMLSTGAGPEVPLATLGVAVQEVVAEAIMDAARASNRGQAPGIGGQ